MAFEDFGIDQNDVELELSYLPMELISTIDCPPVIIGNDRQVKNFFTYVRGKASTKLCVSISPVNGNSDNIELDGEQSKSPFRELGEPSSFSPRDGIASSSESRKDVEDECNSNASEEDKDVDLCGKEDDRGKCVRFSLKDVVKRGETFQNKSKLKAALEMSAMKNNFDYKVVNSDRKLWYIRCVDNKCKWSVRAEGLSGSIYFFIKNYVADHTCDASSMNNGCRTASAKTIGSLIMHRYDGVKEGPKANDIIHIMRMEHGCEISKSLAWDAHADVTKWARCQFQGYRYDIRTTNPAESINPALHSPREYPVIPLLDSIREMLTRWFYERRTRRRKHTEPLTIAIEKKIDRRINKGKPFLVQPVNEHPFLVRGDTIDCLVDLDRRTCSCGKYDLLKIPCRDAIKTGVPEDSWVVPDTVRNADVLAPESRRGPGRRRKRRYETVEDKIRSSQGAQEKKRRS
ncbi:hypothetical protein F2Q69_00047992 [Brassica cretica]|uniref:SWIM-type domain-containing protein n=1 Tax=Brassica cretica TaxID=69181 RepID=A0A8S9PQT0_BRACR|nr:hypothetical protein F2Q69_00047992 [Brassica cretica]